MGRSLWYCTRLNPATLAFVLQLVFLAALFFMVSIRPIRLPFQRARHFHIGTTFQTTIYLQPQLYTENGLEGFSTLEWEP